MGNPESNKDVVILEPSEAPILDRAKVISDFREILGHTVSDPENIDLTVERMKRIFPVEGVVIVPRSSGKNSEGVILEVTQGASGSGILRFDVGVSTQEGMRNKAVMAKGLLDLNPEGARENPLKDAAPIDPKKRYMFKGQPAEIVRMTAGGHYALVSPKQSEAEWVACDQLKSQTDMERAKTPILQSKPTRPGGRRARRA